MTTYCPKCGKKSREIGENAIDCDIHGAMVVKTFPACPKCGEKAMSHTVVGPGRAIVSPCGCTIPP